MGSTDNWRLTAIDTRRTSLVVLGEEARRKDHLLATLERIPPQLEAQPRDERESPVTPTEEAEPRPGPATGAAQEGMERVSWWRRVFGP